jgi:2-amino-4-hydroxy-6-hydroxymethyldihydropteridine diphosphokinase
MHPACIGIGSNLHDRAAYISAAIDALARLPATALIAHAPPIETDPVGPVEQGPFLNTAALIETTLTPRALVESLLAIEAAAGRDRAASARWGPRTLDLDLLLYGDLVIDEPGLTVPHPRMHERRFVLQPLAAIAPHARHPALNRTVADLLAALSDLPAPAGA